MPVPGLQRAAILTWAAAHLHPLNYALGLAQAAANAGVRIYESTEVTGIDEGKPVKVRRSTPVAGQRRNHVVLACNGYLGNLNRKIAARVMPINNFIAATEPLGPDTRVSDPGRRGC